MHPERPDLKLPREPAAPIRALRLSTVFAELGRTHGPADAAQAGAPGAAGESTPNPRRIRSDLTIGELVDSTGHAGFGFMYALLALMSVPVPGVSPVAGLAIALGAVQMSLGFQKPWLPNFVRRRQVSVATLDWISNKLTRWTRGMERIIRPRFELLTRGPFWCLCGVAILFQALGLALPLPIPWSNSIFSVPIILYAIGLLEADGLLIMICHALTAVEIAACIRFWDVIVRALMRVWQAIEHLWQ